MSGFSARWLELREPFDAAARSGTAAGALAELPRRGERLRLVDLGAGTGANIRYLAPLLAGRQDWLAVDRDAELLAALPEQLRRWADDNGGRFRRRGEAIEVEGDTFTASVALCRADLFREPPPLQGAQLVSASALLDLVSAEWLDAILSRCCSEGAAVLFALAYDGEIAWRPREEGDALVRELVNRHQRTDKGFGPALGPAAVDHGAARLRRLGYDVRLGRSDWVIGCGAIAIQQALVDDWSAAARAVSPRDAGAVDAWRRRRLARLREGTSSLVVGHQDLVGLPPGDGV
ncbi:MAG: class I SAM-dependent methyltransferase [Pseudomonadota bacterium]